MWEEVSGIGDLFSAKADANAVRLFLVLYCGAITLQLLYRFREQKEYFTASIQFNLQPSRRLLGIVEVPRLSVKGFTFAGACMLVSLFFVCLGIAPRLFLGISLVCFFLYFAQIPWLGYVGNKTMFLPVVFLTLMAAPSIDKGFSCPTPLWPLVLTKVLIAIFFFGCGIQKLRLSGFRWARGRPLQAYLITQHLRGDVKYGWLLAQSLSACALVSVLTLGLELSFPLLLVFPDLTSLFLIAAFLFHTGVAITMRINFFAYFAPVYLVFITDWSAEIINIVQLCGDVNELIGK